MISPRWLTKRRVLERLCSFSCYDRSNNEERERERRREKKREKSGKKKK
jgi:hypothetical protein